MHIVVTRVGLGFAAFAFIGSPLITEYIDVYFIVIIVVVFIITTVLNMGKA